MRTVLLIRHAPVDYLNGKSCCLGSRTDAPITSAGWTAAAKLAPILQNAGIASVWSSPMLRCRQTAEAITNGLLPGLVPGMEELDCGAWDGLSFEEIRTRFPEDYARRGLDPALPPPGGELPSHAAQRGLDALHALAARTAGNLAVIAHAGINRAMLCALTDRPMAEMRQLPQPCLCVNVLRYDGKRFTVSAVGRIADGLNPTKEESSHEETL